MYASKINISKFNFINRQENFAEEKIYSDTCLQTDTSNTKR